MGRRTCGDRARGSLARGAFDRGIRGGARATLARCRVLDPPRSGAGREVVEAVAGLRPQTVVYVACDPVALARDLAVFQAFGYDTTRIDAVDLFPNSHHIEAIATLTRTVPHR